MKNKRFYAVGLILSVVAFFGAVFIPDSQEDLRALVVLLCMACFIVFLIALIVSTIRARIKPKSAPETPVPQFTPEPTHITPPQQSKPAPKKATTIEKVYLRGVDKYADNIESIAIENDDYNLSKRELQEDFLDERVWQYQFFAKAALVPEPDNEYDPNAIMVQSDGLCVGYVPRESTAHIRELMESGRIQYLGLNIGGGKYKEVTEIDDDEYELERGKVPYSGVLKIHLTEE